MRPTLTMLVRSFVLFLLACGLATAQGIRLPDYSRHTLDNGTVVLLMPKQDVPLIAMNVVIRGGALADPEGKSGTAALLAELMQKGAGGRDAMQFANAIDAAGGRLSIESGQHALALSAEFLAKDANLMLDLAADALRRPKLEQTEFEKVRTRAIQSLQSAKDGGPDRLISYYGRAWLFGQHPYGQPNGGSERSLAAIAHAGLTGYARQQLGGDRTVIAVVGDFEPKAMLAEVSQRFADWDKASIALPQAEPPQVAQQRRVLLIDKPDATQSYFWLGQLGASVSDPARPAQELVRTVFGGRFTSMLNTELRVKSGLTYGARAAIERHVHPGAAAITSFTRTESTEQALDMALATLDALHTEGLDQAAFESGRNYMLGQFPPSLETGPQLASELSYNELYGLGREQVDGFADRLLALDLSQVNQASRVFARSDHLNMVVIGKAEAIRKMLAKYGPVTEMAISDPDFAPAR